MTIRIIIRCFGPPAVFAGQYQERLLLSRSALQLLIYLSIHARHRVPREQLTEEIWPETAPKKSASRLTSALWRLRKALRSAGCDDLVRSGADGTLTLQLGTNAALDTVGFVEAAESFLRQEKALALPKGSLPDDRFAQPYLGWYAPWVLRHRLRLENLFEKCLRVSLDRQIAAKAYRDAIDTAERLLEVDPLLEDVQEQLIDVYIAQGRTVLARRQYDQCCALLAAELGVAPSDRLTRKIRRVTEARHPDSAREPLVSASRLLNKTQRDLKRVSDIIALST